MNLLLVKLDVVHWLALWKMGRRYDRLNRMKKTLCWVQLIAIVILVLMAPCTRCTEGFSGRFNPVSIGDLGSHEESEDHHFCASIHCSCHGMFCPIPITVLGLEDPVSESFGYLPAPCLETESVTDIFQPPRASIG